MNKEVLEALVQEVLDEMSMTGTGASVTPGTGEGVATKYAFAKKKDGNKIAKDYMNLYKKWCEDEVCYSKSEKRLC